MPLVYCNKCGYEHLGECSMPPMKDGVRPPQEEKKPKKKKKEA